MKPQSSLLRHVLSLLTFVFGASVLLANPPEEGIVVEGVMVPGVFLGDSKAMVESAYGSPGFCQGPEQDFCTYNVPGTGSVHIKYVGPDGGASTGTDADTVFYVLWYGYTDWSTVEGITTDIALADPQSVIDAYPNAQVVYNSFGQIYSVRDAELGIAVIWQRDFYSGTVNVAMQIFEGTVNPDPDPEPEPELLNLVVKDISFAKKRRTLYATVEVLDGDSAAVSGANVSIEWMYPDGETQVFSALTNSDGKAQFTSGSMRGTHTVFVLDVSKTGYEYDSEGSEEIEDSIYARR